MSVKHRTIKQMNSKTYFGKGEPITWPSPDELIGIELEAENAYVSDGSVLTLAGWRTERDGSLRGDGLEFVLASPLAGSSLTRAIHTLFACHKESIVRFRPSPRAGTHVHINWQDDTVESAVAMVALMYCIEPMVYAWADEDRAWCSYCNPLSDIPSETMSSLLNLDEYVRSSWLISEVVEGNVGRYYGFNFSALIKYGTMELRYFPSTTSAKDMIKWVKFAQLAKLAALKWTGRIIELLERLSEGDVSSFLEEHFDCDGIAEELLTAVNDPSTMVRDKASELLSVLDMRSEVCSSQGRNPAVLEYIKSLSGPRPENVTLSDSADDGTTLTGSEFYPVIDDLPAATIDVSQRASVADQPRPSLIREGGVANTAEQMQATINRTFYGSNLFPSMIIDEMLADTYPVIPTPDTGE